MVEISKRTTLGSLEATLCRGDITGMQVDAVVNAANSALCGGSGVDGAIHQAAGPELLEACALLGRCPTGESVLTPGFGLPARFVIHTVGPVWNGGQADEEALLASCYQSSLRLADEHGLATIAFPAISTGAYRFPKVAAAHIAVRSCAAFEPEGDGLKQVFFVTFDRAAEHISERALRPYPSGPGGGCQGAAS